MSQKNNPLELYICEKLNEIGIPARPTRGSGSGNEIADISNDRFYIECKIRATESGIHLNRKVWNKLCAEVANNMKTPFYATENSYGERFIILNAEDFFRLIKQGIE